eukprot:gene7256-6841_t
MPSLTEPLRFEVANSPLHRSKVACPHMRCLGALLAATVVGVVGQVTVRVATWNIELVGIPGSSQYDAALE